MKKAFSRTIVSTALLQVLMKKLPLQVNFELKILLIISNCSYVQLNGLKAYVVQ